MVTRQDLMSKLFVRWYPNPSRVPGHKDQIIIELITRGPFQWVDVTGEFPDLFQYLFVRESVGVFRSVKDLILFLDEGQESDFDKTFGSKSTVGMFSSGCSGCSSARQERASAAEFLSPGQ
jgi:hypothetical protein